MTAFTTIASGDWEDPDTWSVGSGRFPGDGVDTSGDTVVITNYNVTFTAASQTAVDAGQGYVGLATGSGFGIEMEYTRTGSLTLNADLQVRGSWAVYGAHTITQAAGTTLDLWAPAAGSLMNFRFTSGQSWTINGTSGSKAVVTNSNHATGTYYIKTHYETSISCLLDWTHVNVSNLGSGSLYGVWSEKPDTTIDFTNVLFNNCGTIYQILHETDYSFLLTNCDFREPADATIVEIASAIASTTGSRAITNCTAYDSSADLVLQLDAPDVTVSGGVYWNSSIAGNYTTNRESLDCTITGATFLSTSVTANPISWPRNANLSVDECLLISNKANPYGAVESDAINAASTENIYTDNVFDGFNNTSGDFGDTIIIKGEGSIYRSLCINNAGTPVTLLKTGGGHVLNHLEHCTVHNCKGFIPGESATASTDLENVRSNIFVDGQDGIEQGTSFVSQGAQFILNYNNYYNMTDAANLDYGGNNTYVGPQTYANWWSSGSYGDANKGANDIYADPGFVDDTRTIGTWDTANGGAGTITSTRDEMIKLNGFNISAGTATFDTDYTIALAMAYLRAGFTPTNASLDGTAHDGGDFGAIAFDVGFSQSVSGSLTPSGSLTMVINLTTNIAGSITGTGSVSKQTNKSVSGSTTSVGSVTKRTARTITGSISSVGSLLKQLARTLTGSLTASGEPNPSFTTLQSAVGSITASGIVSGLIVVITGARWIKRMGSQVIGWVTPNKRNHTRRY